MFISEKNAFSDETERSARQGVNGRLPVQDFAPPRLNLEKREAVPARRRSFTLMEVIVASIILAAAFGGLFAAYLYAGRQSADADRRLIAAGLAQEVLNNLYNEVREDTWENTASPLYASDTSWYMHRLTDAGLPSDTLIINGVTYSGNYTVRKVNGKDYREAKVNIGYSS